MAVALAITPCTSSGVISRSVRAILNAPWLLNDFRWAPRTPRNRLLTVTPAAASAASTTCSIADFVSGMLTTTPPLRPEQARLAPPKMSMRSESGSGAPMRQVTRPLPMSSPAIISDLVIFITPAHTQYPWDAAMPSSKRSMMSSGCTTSGVPGEFSH